MKRSNKIWTAVLGGVLTLGILTATIGTKYWKHRTSHFHNCYNEGCSSPDSNK